MPALPGEVERLWLKIEAYPFESEGGPLTMCRDWSALRTALLAALARREAETVERAAKAVEKIYGPWSVEHDHGWNLRRWREGAAASIRALAAPATEGCVQTYDLVAHLERQRIFSTRAFGPGDRAKGVVAHIRKELLEIEADPHDLIEWVDVTLLALDGAWRQGYTSEEIASALALKLARNESREWPDWRTADKDKPIEHVSTVDESSPTPKGGARDG